MTLLSLTHIVMLLATVAFITVFAIVIRRLPKRVQTVIFACAAAACSLGIFYRYAMGLSFTGGIDLRPLLRQMLQVCNFNFVLIPLLLIPRGKLVGQYVVYFSMFAAATALLSPSSTWRELAWYSPTILNSWINHTLIVAIPIWMLATGRLRPDRKYVLPVTGCVVIYYTVAYGISELMIANGLMTVATSHSFIYDPGGVGILELFYKLIPHPYFYLYPLVPLLALFFFAFSLCFTGSGLDIGVCFKRIKAIGTIKKQSKEKEENHEKDEQ